MRLTRRFLGITLALSLLGGGARAQDTDPADLAFWQSIQNSANPAEYAAYLHAFPQGRFAALARIRAGQADGAAAAAPPAAVPPAAVPTGAPGTLPGKPAALGAPAAPAAPQPQLQPAAAPPGGPVVGQGERIVVTPATVRVGQRVTLRFENFPQANGDFIIVVPAGTPDLDPTDYGANRPLAREVFYGAQRDTEVGPFAPGAYEARYMTTLYNNDRRFEVSARATFTVGVR
ncbi:hypothetical protein M0638_01985 [Roseomonas sp. NAR14]|uniref:Uncharacterized protein n=1 Tax=Roseomonas acroporae TaxID=2937791 RepID=A0A9X2BUK7_9PROT|nr:hypothetical protein [Roseomonas acroporae]MCK8783149.1 hypothetical protein [Roseomonas acroporae]